MSDTLNKYHLTIEGTDTPLDVEDFTGHEGLSRIYCYDIRFTSPEPDISANSILRCSALFSMRTLPQRIPHMTQPPKTLKTVHGIITGFQRLHASREQTLYQITLQPFPALLDKQFRTHRFFVNKSVPEVIKQILDEHHIKGWEYEFHLRQEYPKRPQISQYYESDLKFMQRLLSELGIFYYFTLHPDVHREVLHFADGTHVWQSGKTLCVNSPSGMNASGADAVWALRLHCHVAEKNVTSKDYNYRDAGQYLQSDTADIAAGNGDATRYGEVYHYKQRHPQRGNRDYPEPESANFYARLDHERLLAENTLITGKSTDASLSPGQAVKLTDETPFVPLPELLRSEILVLRLNYTAGRSESLTVSVEAIPLIPGRCWRPPLEPRPKISGTLMARITSAKPGDIYAWQDADGCYRVKFDADQDEHRAGMESMPVRLAKPYAGDKYGHHFPLIQGTEVAIAFEEGDPDRPYIAHALHDSCHPDHVTEKNSTRNVLRTPASNKLRMEDKRGEEHIKLSTEYGGKTQLNLGHNVNSHRSRRGEGAELRTDDWVAVRGGKGVFITADAQPAAGGDMLDMQAVLTQLKQASDLTEALKNAAETARAELADIRAQKALLQDTLTELKQAALLFSAPEGIAAGTPKHIQLAAGENLMVSSGNNSDFSVLKKFTVAAGEIISLFAQKMGIKIVAGRGKMEIQAQEDEMALDALKDLRISSSEGKVVIRAEQEILLVSGGAYLRIGNGQVEAGAPDKIIHHTAVYQKLGAKSASEMAMKWDKSDFAITPQVYWNNTGKPAKAQTMNITRDDGTLMKLQTDEQGYLPKQAALFVEQILVEKDKNNDGN